MFNTPCVLNVVHAPFLVCRTLCGREELQLFVKTAVVTCETEERLELFDRLRPWSGVPDFSILRFTAYSFRRNSVTKVGYFTSQKLTFRSFLFKTSLLYSTE